MTATTALQALTVLLPVGYLLAAVLYAMDFGGPGAPQVGRTRRVVLGCALALHVLLFGVLGAAAGGLPSLGLWHATSAIALCTALLFGVVTRSLEHEAVGAVVLGLVFLLQLVSSAFLPLEIPRSTLTPATATHVATSVLASSSVVLSGTLGAMYLLLYRQMRRRSFGPLFRRLPDLETLARLTRRSALSGFVFLGIGLNAGIALAHGLSLSAFSYADPWVLVILGVWLHFGAVAFSHLIPGLNAWRASVAAAAGLAVLACGFFINLTAATFHLQG